MIVILSFLPLAVSCRTISSAIDTESAGFLAVSTRSIFS